MIIVGHKCPGEEDVVWAKTPEHALVSCNQQTRAVIMPSVLYDQEIDRALEDARIPLILFPRANKSALEADDLAMAKDVARMGLMSKIP